MSKELSRYSPSNGGGGSEEYHKKRGRAPKGIYLNGPLVDQSGMTIGDFSGARIGTNNGDNTSDKGNTPQLISQSTPVPVAQSPLFSVPSTQVFTGVPVIFPTLESIPQGFRYAVYALPNGGFSTQSPQQPGQSVGEQGKTSSSENVDSLKAQLAAIQAKLETLSGGKKTEEAEKGKEGDKKKMEQLFTQNLQKYSQAIIKQVNEVKNLEERRGLIEALNLEAFKDGIKNGIHNKNEVIEDSFFTTKETQVNEAFEVMKRTLNTKLESEQAGEALKNSLATFSNDFIKEQTDMVDTWDSVEQIDEYLQDLEDGNKTSLKIFKGHLKDKINDSGWAHGTSVIDQFLNSPENQDLIRQQFERAKSEIKAFTETKKAALVDGESGEDTVDGGDGDDRLDADEERVRVIDARIADLRARIDREKLAKPPLWAGWFDSGERRKRKESKKLVLDLEQEILKLEAMKRGGPEVAEFDVDEHKGRIGGYTPTVLRQITKDSKKNLNLLVSDSIEQIRGKAKTDREAAKTKREGLEAELNDRTKKLTQAERDQKLAEIAELKMEEKRIEFLKRKQLLEEARKKEGFARRTWAVFKENIHNPDTWKRGLLAATIAGFAAATLPLGGLPAFFGSGILGTYAAGATIGSSVGVATEVGFGKYLRNRDKEYGISDGKITKKTLAKNLLFAGTAGAVGGAVGVGLRGVAQNLIGSHVDSLVGGGKKTGGTVPVPDDSGATGPKSGSGKVATPDSSTNNSGGQEHEASRGGKSSNISGAEGGVHQRFTLSGPNGEQFFNLNKIPNSQTVLRAALQGDKTFISMNPKQQFIFIENLDRNLFNPRARFQVKEALFEAFNIKDKRMQFNFLHGKINLDELIADKQNFSYEKFRNLFMLKVGGKHSGQNFLQVALEKIKPGAGSSGSAIVPHTPTPKPHGIIRGSGKIVDA